MEVAFDIAPFLAKVRAKYKAVIVDEFQDTDPIQWRIFEKLFLETHLLYLVGDPKQSIYGFRNADIYTYMHAAEALGADKKAYLDTNFRSTPQLIERAQHPLHRAARMIFPPFTPRSTAIPSSQSRAQRIPIWARATHSIFRCAGQTGQREKLAHQSDGRGEALSLHCQRDYSTAQRACDPLFADSHFDQRPLPGRANAAPPQPLEDPFTDQTNLQFDQSRGFAAMEMLLKATAHPENESLVRAVLYGPRMQTMESPFFLLKQLFEEKGFAPFFAEFIHKYFKSDTALYLELRQTALNL